jgi:hypothetical protein
MAEFDARALLKQLASMTPEQLKALQTRVDALENRGRSSHHETTSHHHTTALLDFDIPGTEEKR